jgi:hypothetical protein
MAVVTVPEGVQVVRISVRFVGNDGPRCRSRLLYEVDHYVLSSSTQSRAQSKVEVVRGSEGYRGTSPCHGLILWVFEVPVLSWSEIGLYYPRSTMTWTPLNEQKPVSSSAIKEYRLIMRVLKHTNAGNKRRSPVSG